MDREQYLSYIRELHNRISSEHQKKGTTLWAFTIALVYIVWSSVPYIPKVINDNNQVNLILGIFCHLFPILIFSAILIAAETNIGIRRLFDYRIPLNTERYKFGNLFLILFIFALPLLGNTFYLLKGYSAISKFEVNVLIVNIIFFLIFYLIIIFYVFKIFWEAIKTGLPSPLEINTQPATAKLRLLMVIIFLILVAGNIYSLLGILHQSLPYSFIEISLLGFNATLIIFFLPNFYYLFFSHYSLKSLENLERDILLHQIEEGEIKTRLEEELFGQEIGSWLSEKIKEVKKEAEIFLEEINNFDDFKNEIEGLDPNLRFEKKERIKEKEKITKDKYDRYRNTSLKISQWLGNWVKYGSLDSDEYLQEVFRKNLKELERIRDNLSEIVKLKFGSD
ncbi:MAG: hypothetical protein IH886_15675 [Nitrospinae bacterium]|nr:hypothetical protein [Nitrospinota bacterium]